MKALQRLGIQLSFDRIHRAVALSVIVAVAALGAGAGTSIASVGSAATKAKCVKITVWYDAARQPAVTGPDGYNATHKSCPAKAVLWGGDSNGASEGQTDVEKWNRAGSGWPDVMFSEQVNDPVWMAQAPFSYAASLKGVIPQKYLKDWPAPSLAQCTVKHKLICLQDDLAQEVLWVNGKLMKKFHYKTPTTWQQWAAIGKSAAKHHKGYIIGAVGDSFGAWLYYWANKCPLQHLQGKHLLINVRDKHCTEMTKLLQPLIKDGSVAYTGATTTGFPKQYGGAHDKILMMPGPSWYTGFLQSTLHVPSGQITAALPLRWGNSSTITTGQVGGGPWIISRHDKGARLKAAANFVIWETTKYNPLPITNPNARPGYPAYGPMAKKWVEAVGHSSYFYRNPAHALIAATNLIWRGWSIVTYSDQPFWTSDVAAGLAQGKPLASLLQAYQNDCTKQAELSGYHVVH